MTHDNGAYVKLELAVAEVIARAYWKHNNQPSRAIDPSEWLPEARAATEYLRGYFTGQIDAAEPKYPNLVSRQAVRQALNAR